VRLHIFDVDYTIVRCSTVREFVFAGLRAGIVGASIGFYAPYLFLRYSLEGSSGSHSARAYPFFRNVPKAKLETLARTVFADRLLPKIDRAVCERVESIRNGGGRVIIASSSFETILEPLAAFLKIDEIVASRFEFENGMTTGRVEGEPAFGQGKKSRVLAYLSATGVSPADCAFFTDSYRDLPLLREVGKAVVVNPGMRLRRFARSAGWDILNT
jgi:HAD superfamily hydrolase (TIGR01490 family)